MGCAAGPGWSMASVRTWRLSSSERGGDSWPGRVRRSAGWFMRRPDRLGRAATRTAARGGLDVWHRMGTAALSSYRQRAGQPLASMLTASLAAQPDPRWTQQRGRQHLAAHQKWPDHLTAHPPLALRRTRQSRRRSSTPRLHRSLGRMPGGNRQTQTRNAPLTSNRPVRSRSAARAVVPA
jgi:hypothetical protein